MAGRDLLKAELEKLEELFPPNHPHFRFSHATVDGVAEVTCTFIDRAGIEHVMSAFISVREHLDLMIFISVLSIKQYGMSAMSHQCQFSFIFYCINRVRFFYSNYYI